MNDQAPRPTISNDDPDLATVADMLRQNYDEVEAALVDAGQMRDPLAPYLPQGVQIRRMARERDAARVALQAAMRTPVWVDAAVALPKMATGPGHCAGWSHWVMCTDATRLNDAGPTVFTAAYSHILHRWQKLGSDQSIVTHWQDLPTAPQQRAVASDTMPR